MEVVLGFLEFDMLAQDGIIFLDREFFRHGARVLLGDIEEAGLAFAVEANFGGGRFGHGELQKERMGGGVMKQPLRPVKRAWARR